jgi:hypothetical protein
VDSNAIANEGSSQILLSALNLDLGFYIDNWNFSDISFSSKLVHKVLPFPFYLLHRHAKDNDGLYIYLADGGNIENLGAYSLAKRACKNMIIVDAEYDPDYKFSAYTKLKRMLLNEMGLSLFIKEIDDEINDSKLDENDRKRYFKSNPISNGKLSTFMFDNALDSKLADFDANIYYIKLVIPDSADLPATVMDYHSGHAQFPQESTIDQNYTASQFVAYRDLGEYLVKKFGQVMRDEIH